MGGGSAPRPTPLSTNLELSGDPGWAQGGPGTLQPLLLTPARSWPRRRRKPSQEAVSEERDGWLLPTPPLYI